VKKYGNGKTLTIAYIQLPKDLFNISETTHLRPFNIARAAVQQQQQYTCNITTEVLRLKTNTLDQRKRKARSLY
jgi:hypothetical protein